MKATTKDGRTYRSDYNIGDIVKLLTSRVGTTGEIRSARFRVSDKRWFYSLYTIEERLDIHNIDENQLELVRRKK